MTPRFCCRSPIRLWCVFLVCVIIVLVGCSTVEAAKKRVRHFRTKSTKRKEQQQQQQQQQKHGHKPKVRGLVDDDSTTSFRDRQLQEQKISVARESLGGTGGVAFKTGQSELFFQMMSLVTPRSPAPSDVSATATPSMAPTRSPYVPGNLTRVQAGLILSEGLTARIIARSGRKIRYNDGSTSEDVFHFRPDGGDTFNDIRPNNLGGWVYVSNSEVEDFEGSVGAITFNRDGEVIDYRKLLTGSEYNCGGGRTPWNTWVSCEEVPGGRVWQVDPMGIMEPQVTSLGGDGGGEFESFAYDIRDLDEPKFFVSEDEQDGALRRFIPEEFDWRFPWDMLHGEGTLQYLMLQPSNTSDAFGTYWWTDRQRQAERNADMYYPKSEGIDVHGNILYMVCKEVQYLFEINLDDNTYTRTSTRRGLFEAQPDGIRHILTASGQSHVYFTEDGGFRNGIHTRDPFGNYLTILEAVMYIGDETTGVAFSPDDKHLYFAYQENGLVFDVTREDGLPFHASLVDLKYHSVNPRNRQGSRK